MALKMAITHKGIALPDAYHRITTQVLSRGRGDLMVTIGTYPSAATAQPENELVSSTHFLPYNPNATVATAYAHLKTLPEYAGAVDV